MIFASLGLLIAAGGLLAGGITNSNVGLLVASFACTAVAGILLMVAYASARNAAGLGAAQAGMLPVAIPGGAPAPVPGTQPVLMYVPISQVPGAMQPVGVAAGANGGTVPAAAGSAAAFAPASPFLGYDDMTADQVVKLVASGALTVEQLVAVRDYEAGGQARKTVLDKIDRAIR
jgi:hypothetical protein